MEINITLIGQTISFMILVIITVKWIWPPLFQAMEERREKIARGIEAAEKSEIELRTVEEKVAEMLKEAKLEAAEILEQANKRSAEIVAESKEAARVEGEKLQAHTEAQIEHEFKQAQEKLQKQVAQLAVAGAEKIIAREIAANDHEQMLEDLANQL